MKLLLLFVHDLRVRPFAATGADADPGVDGGASGEIIDGAAVLALVHAEPTDELDPGRVVTRAIKQVKWVAGKFGSRRVVLHPFAHLASRSAPAPLARSLLAAMRARLEGAGYAVQATPFGWVHELELHVAGESLAKVFVDIPPPGGATE